MEEGSIDPETVARACLAYMSESEVIDMAHDNELLIDDDVYDEDTDEDEEPLIDNDY